MRKAPWLLLALAIALRAYGAVITPIPGRDGVAYLWMAEQFAAGDPAAMFQTVFHPLYPFLTGLLLLGSPSLDSVAAGQLVAGGCAALAVVPLWASARAVFGERAAVWAAVMYSVGTWFVRHPSECMSEGPFYLLAACWAAALTSQRRRPVPAGVAAGLAFLVRPEGAALAVTGIVFLCAARGARRSLGYGVAALTVAALLPLASMGAGPGFTLTPKAAFNWQVGAGSTDSPLSWYLAQWLRWPGDAWEGLGYVVFPLAMYGAFRHRPRALGDPRLCLVLPFLAQVAVVPLLKSHHRFASGLGVLLLPFAGVAFVECRARLRERWRWWPLAATMLLFLSEARLLVDRPADRTIERDLGRWLASHREAGATIASDMPRLVFFAGLPPPPPRRIEGEELLALAQRPECRYVVLKRGRTEIDLGALARLGYAERGLPAALSSHPHGGEIVLLGR